MGVFCQIACMTFMRKGDYDLGAHGVVLTGYGGGLYDERISKFRGKGSMGGVHNAVAVTGILRSGSRGLNGLGSGVGKTAWHFPSMSRASEVFPLYKQPTYTTSLFHRFAMININPEPSLEARLGQDKSFRPKVEDNKKEPKAVLTK